MRTLFPLALVLFCCALPGCQTAAEHASDVRAGQDADGRLTVGTVQREISVGMSGADVARVLGSPNIVTTDDKRREVWIYDKISTERIYSTSSSGVSTLILGGAGGSSGIAGAGVGGSTSGSAGAGSVSQRTLTVIIKFDEEGAVRDFAYHTSRF